MKNKNFRLHPSRKAFILFVGLFVILLLLAGCRRVGQDVSDVRVNLTLAPNPPSVGLTTVSVALSDAGGQPVSGAQVELEGNMVHAGMAPTFSKPAEVAPGRYEAPLEFTMAGDWFILVKATLPDGRKVERQVDVRGVKGE